MADMVNHPPHYELANGLECIDIIEIAVRDNPDPFCGYLHGNILKYAIRAYEKENPCQDFKKCRWYLDRLIEELEKEEG